MWKTYLHNLATKGLPSQFNEMETSGRLQNFRNVKNGVFNTFDGFRFNDSDVYKWLEAAAYVLESQSHPDLQKMVDECVSVIESAQDTDGYVNTFFQLNPKSKRFSNLAVDHEMYCAGHLIEAGVAWFERHGERRLLNIGIKFADLLVTKFGKAEPARFCGHPEIEFALLRLWKVTGNQTYFDLAKRMIDHRGERPSTFEQELTDPETGAIFPAAKALHYKDGKYDGAYAQDHAPIHEHRTIEGHSVRAAYLYAAVAWINSVESNEAQIEALEAVWSNLTLKRMYVTGGIGSSGTNEGFTHDYDLPNLNAYAETCAGIALAMWGSQMFALTKDSAYMDIVERTLFNGVLSGISWDTTMYFYENPLESRANTERKTFFPCACCPANVARTIGLIDRYALSVDGDRVYIHFPISGEWTLKLPTGEAVLSIATSYPQKGGSIITIKKAPKAFELAIRIPDWAEEVTTDLKGSEDGAEYDQGYAVFSRSWRSGDTVELDFHMEPKWVESHPAILDNSGRLALSYGPTIYAAEELELAKAPQLAQLLDIEQLEQTGTALDGSPLFRIPVIRETLDFPDEPYAELETTEREEATLTLKPYRLWANSGPSYMQVWLRHS